MTIRARGAARLSNDRLTTIRARLPQVFSRMPRAPYEIRRVPPEIEIGAPGGSAQAGNFDGSRPGIFFINLLIRSRMVSATRCRRSPFTRGHRGICSKMP